MDGFTGILYLIPSLLSAEAPQTLPAYVTAQIGSLRHYFVENERSARRFFRLMDRDISIDDRHFHLLAPPGQPDPENEALLRSLMAAGDHAGLVSEAGYPCVADPGGGLVALAHRAGARVVPLVGPNAMLMALAASGLNGQRFRFSGYLPVDSKGRVKALLDLEREAWADGSTQLFMETPYRNHALLKDIVEHCRRETLLCVACDLTAPGEFIRTRPVGGWHSGTPDLHKRPAVFLLGRP